MWSVRGSLPPGLSFSLTGVLSGTPSAAGSFSFTVTATDVKLETGSQSYTVVIHNLPAITTATLPAGTAGAAYSQTIGVTNGTTPYQYAVTAGSLPGGLTLDGSSGVIQGTPGAGGAFSFTITVTDHAGATAAQSYNISIGGGTSGTLSVAGLPATASSGAQTPFDVTVSSPASRRITGQVTLNFQPSAAVPKDDPAIQFSSGGRTVNFMIPPGGTRAIFPVSPIALQTGTVAGTIRLAVSSDLPGGAAADSIAIAPSAPVIRSATIVPTASGFQVQLAGFSNSRELAAAAFHFTASSGQTLQTSDLTVNLASLSNQWYAGDSSNAFGGQFLLVVPFSMLQGTTNGLASVRVQLLNGQSSATVTTTF